jgi:hypothetical protein
VGQLGASGHALPRQQLPGGGCRAEQPVRSLDDRDEERQLDGDATCAPWLSSDLAGCVSIAVYSKSTDGGVSWSPPARVFAAATRTPIGYRCASFKASRVFPTLPGPVSVTRRLRRSNSPIASSSRARPTREVSASGRLWSAELPPGPTGAEVVAIAREHDRRARDRPTRGAASCRSLLRDVGGTLLVDRRQRVGLDLRSFRVVASHLRGRYGRGANPLEMGDPGLLFARFWRFRLHTAGLRRSTATGRKVLLHAGATPGLQAAAGRVGRARSARRRWRGIGGGERAAARRLASMDRSTGAGGRVASPRARATARPLALGGAAPGLDGT